MYIRTKDGIYKVDEVKPYFLDEKQKLFINNELKVAINEQRVINQSENLEELCDCFVTKGIRHIVWDKQRNKNITFEQVKFSFASKDFKLYGAIWTSKGLIYVAKMNEKGELCLL